MRKLSRRLLWTLGVWRLLGSRPRPRFGPGQVHPWRLGGRTVFIGDRELLVRQGGLEDGPDVVLVHGLGGSSLAEWYEVGPRLAERFRVTIVDHRSHGLSTWDTGRFEVDDLADDLAAVLSAVGVDQADVVGYSMGGAIAQTLAHRHPHRVRRLALIGTFTHHPTSWRLPRIVGLWFVRAAERLTGVGVPEVRAGYLIGTGAVAPHHAQWMWEETHRRDPEAALAASLALLRFDSRPWVGRLRVPALVVIPTLDQLVPPSWQYQLAASLRDARVVELVDAHHEVPWTHPDRIAEALIEFLEKDG